MKYDLIKDGAILQSNDFNEGTQPTLSANKGEWLPRQTIEPAYNEETHHLVLNTSVTATHSVWTYVVTPNDLEGLRELRYSQNNAHSNLLVQDARSRPAGSITLDARGVKQSENRRNNRAKSNTRMSDNDDALADYIDLVCDDLDTADSTVENLDRASLEVWDSATSTTWSVWTPPPIL